MVEFRTKLWTSDLLVSADSSFSLEEEIESFKEEEKLYSRFLNDSVTIKMNSRLMEYIKKESITPDELNSFCFYNSRFDCTGLMKGYALSVMRDKLNSLGLNSFIINFGGDLVVKNCTTKLPNINHIMRKSYSVFTSSNLSVERGHHIFGEDAMFSVISKGMDYLIRGDMLATQLVAGKVTVRNLNKSKFFQVEGFLTRRLDLEESVLC